jgi:hypothetical protein
MASVKSNNQELQLTTHHLDTLVAWLDADEGDGTTFDDASDDTISQDSNTDIGEKTCNAQRIHVRVLKALSAICHVATQQPDVPRNQPLLSHLLHHPTLLTWLCDVLYVECIQHTLSHATSASRGGLHYPVTLAWPMLNACSDMLLSLAQAECVESGSSASGVNRPLDQSNSSPATRFQWEGYTLSNFLGSLLLFISTPAPCGMSGHVHDADLSCAGTWLHALALLDTQLATQLASAMYLLNATEPMDLEKVEIVGHGAQHIPGMRNIPTLLQTLADKGLLRSPLCASSLKSTLKWVRDALPAEIVALALKSKTPGCPWMAATLSRLQQYTLLQRGQCVELSGVIPYYPIPHESNGVVRDYEGLLVRMAYDVCFQERMAQVLSYLVNGVVAGYLPQGRNEPSTSSCAWLLKLGSPQGRSRPCTQQDASMHQNPSTIAWSCRLLLAHMHHMSMLTTRFFDVVTPAELIALFAPAFGAMSELLKCLENGQVEQVCIPAVRQTLQAQARCWIRGLLRRPASWSLFPSLIHTKIASNQVHFSSRPPSATGVRQSLQRYDPLPAIASPPIKVDRIKKTCTFMELLKNVLGDMCETLARLKVPPPAVPAQLHSPKRRVNTRPTTSRPDIAKEIMPYAPFATDTLEKMALALHAVERATDDADLSELAYRVRCLVGEHRESKHTASLSMFVNVPGSNVLEQGRPITPLPVRHATSAGAVSSTSLAEALPPLSKVPFENGSSGALLRRGRGLPPGVTAVRVVRPSSPFTPTPPAAPSPTSPRSKDMQPTA